MWKREAPRRFPTTKKINLTRRQLFSNINDRLSSPYDTFFLRILRRIIEKIIFENFEFFLLGTY